MTSLNFVMQFQQQRFWCWAATSVSVSAFFNPATSWTQCTLVNAEFGRKDCCMGYPYRLPPGKNPADIVAIGIASDDHCYAWYRDGTVSSGTSDNLGKYRPPYPYHLPPGKNPADIVAIEIASDDHCYAWYRDSMVSSGTSDNLGRYRPLYGYDLPSGKSPTDIVTIGIASNDTCYAWYKGGTVSTGTSDDLNRTCDKPWYPEKSLARTNNLRSWSSGAGSMSEVAKEINNGCPVCVRIGWSGGGGHAVAIFGYDMNLNMVSVADPWTGTSNVNLATFQRAYQGTGSWTHKYFVKP